jgi:adenine-specific DNA-methyltransferase
VKTRHEVTPEKLRGGFYTPRSLVAACLDRIRERMPDGDLRVLEPSAGDGAFIHALARPEWRGRISAVTAIEPHQIEAEKCRHAVAAGRLDGRVIASSAISWAAEAPEVYDTAVGNPPFVRYQFISASDRAAIRRLGARLGIEFAGVSNLWIPVLLAALGRLRPGGTFAFVIPTECLTGCSAGVVRRWLIDECEEISFDLFTVGSFPEVLQEVAILSGRRAARGGTPAPLGMRVVEHLPTRDVEWSYAVADASVWTRYLLDPAHLEALEAAQQLPLARRLGELVAFEVSIVTGANDYFSLDDATLAAYELGPWAVPLLPRTRHAPGLVFTQADREAAQTARAKVWLLDFGAARPDPLGSARARAYLALGVGQGLHKRYKCRVRDPWYRVPGIVQGDLLLSKRSHRWPRVVVNDARSFTTDTIYRGRMVTTERAPEDVAAAFHNSLTLLTAEIEGRSFGGGVLELVPSEIGRLTTLIPRGAKRELPRLDRIARSTHADALISATDTYLVAAGALRAELVPLLREARNLLAARRHDRNRRLPEAEPSFTVEAA